jgi:hypothetical protein
VRPSVRRGRWLPAVPSLPAPASKQEGGEKANGAGEVSARGGGGGRARRRHLHGGGGACTGARAHQRRCVSHLPFRFPYATLRSADPCYPFWFLSRSGWKTDRRPSSEAAGCGTGARSNPHWPVRAPEFVTSSPLRRKYRVLVDLPDLGNDEPETMHSRRISPPAPCSLVGLDPKFVSS